MVLARATNTAVIAEGVERTEELDLIKNIGISNVQGFLLERPSQQPSYDYSCKQLQALTVKQAVAKFEQSMAIGVLAIAQPAISSDTRCKEAHILLNKTSV